MNLIVGVLVGVLAALVAVSGIAAVRSGWMLPTQRKYIVRPRLFGYAQLVIAAVLVMQIAGAVLVSGAEAQGYVRYAGMALMLAVPGLVWASQRPDRAAAR
ncbi:hypothetical protein ABZ070_25745 [Streptomyces sp. NPDC006283]|uniref:hypothetical protein n=1 Tax=Streptomyces sp. NPDC006283 TaxID=3156741 RepID=UPI0033A4D7E1